MTESRRPPRPRLDRSKVLAEAIDLADALGLEALSMRALAARLNVVPMALYKHIADKNDLMGGIVDQVIGGFTLPPAGTGWREKVRFRVLAARTEHLTHPWLGAAISASNRRTEAVLTHMNTVAGDFIEGGVSADLTHYAMHALGNRIWGYSPEAFEDADAPTVEDASQPAIVEYMTARFPHVVAIAMDVASRRPAGGCDQQGEFEFTLDLMLESFERLHAARWVSA